MGSFEVIDEFGKLQRNGGNVASYFCTPEGRVVHAVTGPIKAEELLEEAKWAVKSYNKAMRGGGEDALTQIGRAHQDAAAVVSNNQKRAVHRLLASAPLPPIRNVFQEVFERILGQRVSLPGTGLNPVVDAVLAARERKLPILFILHKRGTRNALLGQWNAFAAQTSNPDENTLGKLSENYVVVSLPLDQMPAVSQRLGIRPFAAPDNVSPLFVVTRSDGRQLAAVTSWDKRSELTRILALGLVQEAKEQPRSKAQLDQVLPLVRVADASLVVDVQRLSKRTNSKAPQTPPFVQEDDVALLKKPTVGREEKHSHLKNASRVADRRPPRVVSWGQGL